ncbi:hypothetical protein Tco_1457664 [Tanacetum coccineum]
MNQTASRSSKPSKKPWGVVGLPTWQSYSWERYGGGGRERFDMVELGLQEKTGVANPIVETDKVIHTVETDIVKLVVEIESFGMSSDESDKGTRSSDGLQPKQADLSCVYELNKLHLHEIRVVPNKHEAD